MTCTANDLVVWPGAKIRLLLAAVKSPGAVALPPFVAQSTITVWPLGADSVAVKTALTVPELPSVTLTSPSESDGWASLSTIVPVPWASAMVALEELTRSTKYVSAVSSSRSALTGTVTCLVVSPGSKSSVPLVASKSAGLAAVSSEVA